MEKHGDEPEKIEQDKKDFVKGTAAGAKKYKGEVARAERIKAKRA